MQYRIKYKILLYTFKAYQPTRALRSEDLQLLKAPRIRTKTYGERRRLNKSAAIVWNSLPQNIRHVQSVVIFKKLLKTHLLRAAYGDTIYIYDLKLFLIIIIFGHVQSVGIF